MILTIILIGSLSVTGCSGRIVKIEGGAGPVIVGDTIFLSSTKAEILAIDYVSGELKWKFPSEGEELKGICDVPTVAGDTVYFGSYDGNVYALDAKTGTEKWQYPPYDHIGAIIGSPAVSSDTIFFGSADGKLYALDSATGEEQWLYPFDAGDKIWSTPVISNGVIYVGSSGNRLYAINAVSGKEMWSFPTEGAVVGSPRVSEGTVYFGSFDNYIYAVDATNGNERWKYEGDDWIWARPVIDNGVIYAGCTQSSYIQDDENFNDTLYALDADSGELRWVFQTEGAIRCAPIMVDNRLVVSSEDGKIHVLDPFDGGELDSFPLKDEDGESRPALPPLSALDTTIYLHTKSAYTEGDEWALYSLDMTTGKQDIIYTYSAK